MKGSGIASPLGVLVYYLVHSKVNTTIVLYCDRRRQEVQSGKEYKQGWKREGGFIEVVVVVVRIVTSLVLCV